MFFSFFTTLSNIKFHLTIPKFSHASFKINLPKLKTSTNKRKMWRQPNSLKSLHAYTIINTHLLGHSTISPLFKVLRYKNIVFRLFHSFVQILMLSRFFNSVPCLKVLLSTSPVYFYFCVEHQNLLLCLLRN